MHDGCAQGRRSRRDPAGIDLPAGQRGPPDPGDGRDPRLARRPPVHVERPRLPRAGGGDGPPGPVRSLSLAGAPRAAGVRGRDHRGLARVRCPVPARVRRQGHRGHADRVPGDRAVAVRRRSARDRARRFASSAPGSSPGCRAGPHGDRSRGTTGGGAGTRRAASSPPAPRPDRPGRRRQPRPAGR